MVSTLFRDPQALSSDLASLGTLQPRAFGSLNRVETLDSASNYYLYSSTHGQACHRHYDKSTCYTIELNHLLSCIALHLCCAALVQY